MSDTLYLDRRLTDGSPGVTVAFATPNTNITIPYSYTAGNTAGVFRVIRTDTGEELTVTSPGVNTIRYAGNLVGVPLVMGLSYPSVFQFSVFYPRNPQTGAPDVRGRLNLRYLKLHYEDTRAFTVYVKAVGRPALRYTFTASADESGIASIPIQSRNTETTITVVSFAITAAGVITVSGNAAGFSGYEWEGMFYNRVAGSR